MKKKVNGIFTIKKKTSMRIEINKQGIKQEREVEGRRENVAQNLMGKIQFKEGENSRRVTEGKTTQM